MPRKIRYKPVSKELEKIVKPSDFPSARTSVGMEEVVGEFFYISVNDLIPFKNQARQSFDKTEIDELAESIRQYGIRQPLTVLKSQNGKYEVVSGERRLRAAKLAGLSKVPCIMLKDASEADAIALVENVHRKDLHPVELGLVYKKLLEQNIFKNQEELAEKTTVPKSKISEYIRYTKVSEDIQSHIINNNISSRDKLREIVSAYEANDMNKIKSLLGLAKKAQESFSILRIISTKGEMKFQEAGVYKLSKNDRRKLKEYLYNLANKIEL